MTGFKMPTACQGGGRDRWRQRAGEDEARSEASHKVTQRRAAGDVTAHHAETLGERTLDHGQTIAEAFAFCDPAAARAIEADRVHLVDICHGTVRVRATAESPNRTKAAAREI